ncbi:MAG: hypothetical protein K940chlam9_00753 [Chlamydiae bacterium]|nr:hypothetical protein [Chlamydiota bacterium]
MKIRLFDKHNLDKLIWPETEEGEFAKKYLTPLIERGTEKFIENAKTDLRILAFDDQVIPITINETDYDNSYLISSYFVAASAKEKAETLSPLPRMVARLLAALYGKLLKKVKINKVVILNNWLLTTNPYTQLTQTQMEGITHFLRMLFPDHYFMFRSINTYKENQVFEALSHANYRMIPCRHVYLYDPTLTPKLSSSTIRKQKKDYNRIKSRNYEVKSLSSPTDEQIERLLTLYAMVYYDKYTKYSPSYTPEYLRHLQMSQLLEVKVLMKGDQIYGVNGFLQKSGYLLVSFFGYDTTVPQEEGLYRMLSGIILEEIEKRKLLSHQGSGAPQFKKWRGYLEEIEYVAIYDKHLPLHRRLFWKMGHFFSSRKYPTTSPSPTNSGSAEPITAG